jgi:hypothetical protein
MLNEARQEGDAAKGQRDRLRLGIIRPHLAEPDNAVMPTVSFGHSQPDNRPDDAALVDRIRSAYKLAVAASPAPTDSFWEQSYFALKRDVHDAILARDPSIARDMLRDPSKSDLLYGFENLAKSILHWQPDGTPSYLDLVTLSQAIGARRQWNPETIAYKPDYKDTFPDIDPLLRSIDERLGFKVTFPNPFPGERGLLTSRGIVGPRAVQALYQAWRISSLVSSKDSAVVEIGAGSGRTAFYASQLGMTNYTIVDIPLTNVAQAKFLGRTLGEDGISLYGEPANKSRIRIIPPTAFFRASDRFDLSVNVDSLTEMARETALEYCAEIKLRSRRFLSINHEFNDFTTREACAEARLPEGLRYPYWMRRGYVEELFIINSDGFMDTRPQGNQSDCPFPH